jgi:hypothetical protein
MAAYIATYMAAYIATYMAAYIAATIGHCLTTSRLHKYASKCIIFIFISISKKLKFIYS